MVVKSGINSTVTTSISGTTPLDLPALFGKGQRSDKLIMKHQIAYHFKKTARQVSQELFVSRKIEIRKQETKI